MANEKRLIPLQKRIIYGGDVFNSLVAEKEWTATEAADFVKVFRTVDAVEVVHAQWLDGYAVRNGKEVYKSIDCSHCEEVFKIESEDREYWKKRFKVCPFCAAVMDGGNEDV